MNLVAADVRRLSLKSEIRNPKSEIARASSRRLLRFRGSMCEIFRGKREHRQPCPSDVILASQIADMAVRAPVQRRNLALTPRPVFSGAWAKEMIPRSAVAPT